MAFLRILFVETFLLYIQHTSTASTHTYIHIYTRQISGTIYVASPIISLTTVQVVRSEWKAWRIRSKRSSIITAQYKRVQVP